jgi:hypothetical protein
VIGAQHEQLDVPLGDKSACALSLELETAEAGKCSIKRVETCFAPLWSTLGSGADQNPTNSLTRVARQEASGRFGCSRIMPPPARSVLQSASSNPQSAANRVNSANVGASFALCAFRLNCHRIDRDVADTPKRERLHHRMPSDGEDAARLGRRARLSGSGFEGTQEMIMLSTTPTSSEFSSPTPRRTQAATWSRLGSRRLLFSGHFAAHRQHPNPTLACERHIRNLLDGWPASTSPGRHSLMGKGGGGRSSRSQSVEATAGLSSATPPLVWPLLVDRLCRGDVGSRTAVWSPSKVASISSMARKARASRSRSPAGKW